MPAEFRCWKQEFFLAKYLLVIIFVVGALLLIQTTVEREVGFLVADRYVQCESQR